jgi:DNA-directed RNA polymerase specialized sigma24 family protein
MLLTDADLVVAARSGDRVAIRTIHDTYCGRLFDHCSAVLRDPETAGDVLSETFMLAFVELHRLGDPKQIEPWLFALARDQMLFRPRSPLLAPERGGVEVLPTEARARALAWEAVSWFDRRERILLDLSLRQGLEGTDLAAATGTSVAHARKLAATVGAKADRMIGAWIVARTGSGCPELEQVPEHALDPRVTMRRVTAHVERCHRCRRARRELPAATTLIASVPAEREPRELRNDALERVDLVLRALESPADTAGDDDTVGYGTLALVDEDDGLADEFDDVLADDANDGTGAAGPGYYDVIAELTPPPVPLGRSGFPPSLFPERRRFVTVLAVLAVGLIVTALVLDVRGGGTYDATLFAGESRPAPTTPASVPPTTASPVSTTPADTTAPSVTNLASAFGCIGPANPTTEVLATVSDNGTIESVDVIITHDVLGSTRKRMLPSGGQYRAEIGPYSEDGAISWTVDATDQDGNLGTNTGRTVGVSQSC